MSEKDVYISDIAAGSKNFARGVKREDVERGAADFGVDLTEHIQFCIEAMKGIVKELELEKGLAGEAESGSN